MKTFTIDAENTITVHASKKAARETGAAVFTSAEELAELIGTDNKRLVEIWNGIPSVTPVTKFTNRKVGAERIWKAIQSLGEAAPAPEPQAAIDPVTPFDEVPAHPAEPLENADTQATAEPAAALAEQPAVAGVGPQAPDVAPSAVEPTKDATPAKKAPKAKKAKPAKIESGPREGSKTAQVVAMLKREGGATITEIMSTWPGRSTPSAASWPAR